MEQMMDKETEAKELNHIEMLTVAILKILESYYDSKHGLQPIEATAVVGAAVSSVYSTYLGTCCHESGIKEACDDICERALGIAQKENPHGHLYH